jgi:hypothetical protein
MTSVWGQLSVHSCDVDVGLRRVKVVKGIEGCEGKDEER